MVDLFAALFAAALHRLRSGEALAGLADQIIRHIQTALDDHLAVHVQPCASDRLKRGGSIVVVSFRKWHSIDRVNLRRIALLIDTLDDPTGIVVIQAVEEQALAIYDGALTALLHAQGRAGQEFEIAVHGHVARRPEVESGVQRHQVVLGVDHDILSLSASFKPYVQLEEARAHGAVLVHAVDSLVRGGIEVLGHTAIRQIKERVRSRNEGGSSLRLVVALHQNAVLSEQL